MLVASVLGKCAKTLFFQRRGGNFRSKFLSRQLYQDAANHVFEKRKDNYFRNYEILRILIKYNGISRALGNAELRVLVRTFFPWDA